MVVLSSGDFSRTLVDFSVDFMVGFDLSVGLDRVDTAISLFENSLLYRRLHHHMDSRLPSWLGSSVIVIRDYHGNLSVIQHVIPFGFRFVQLSLGIYCSSPVTEDVPPRRDRSIHGVPPSVAGLVLSRSVPLHPTSVYTR
jgi:hypothetical protein